MEGPHQTYEYISGEDDLDTMERVRTLLKPVDIYWHPVRDAFARYMDQYTAGNLSDVRFNFYKVCGIPDNSYISFDDKVRLNTSLTVWTFWDYRNIFTEDRSLIIKPEHSIFFRYRFGTPRYPGFNKNKLHLQVKHEYILHCLLKLMTLKDLIPEYSFEWKFSPWNRDSKLRPNDHALRKANAGVAATFVIYISSDSSINKRILMELLRIFPNDEELGLMDTSSKDTLTAGHVRLNRMISYSGTDRGDIMKAIEADMANFSKAARAALPSWIDDMASACSVGTMADINRDSQLYLGLDVCDKEGKPINYASICDAGPRTEDQTYCYMPPIVLDPRTVKNAGGSRKTKRKGGRRKLRRRYTRKH